ncbi:MAG: hypothetical protein QXT34_01915 [Candidatus Aenigmatarchaeota archaeon]
MSYKKYKKHVLDERKYKKEINKLTEYLYNTVVEKYEIPKKTIKIPSFSMCKTSLKELFPSYDIYSHKITIPTYLFSDKQELRRIMEEEILHHILLEENEDVREFLLQSKDPYATGILKIIIEFFTQAIQFQISENKEMLKKLFNNSKITEIPHSELKELLKSYVNLNPKNSEELKEFVQKSLKYIF